MEQLGWKQLVEAATVARTRAYAPYSRYRVGAAVLGDDGEIHLGCNVENSSYGGTICAERVAATQAVAQGARRLLAAVVLTEGSPPAPPCGLCLQVLSELGGKELPVLLTNLQGEERELKLSALLPHAFGPGELPSDDGGGAPRSTEGAGRD